MSEIPPDPHTADQRSATALPTKGERRLAMFVWLCGLLLGLLPSLIFVLAKRKASGWLLDQAKESLNFQIAIFILCFTALVATFLIPFGFVILPAVPISLILNLVVSISAASKAYQGESYRIPLALHWVK